MLAKSESGQILVPGRPDESVMFEKIRAGEMPKGGKPLPAEQIAVIERWIAGGAATRRAEPAELTRGFHLTEEDREFWSFRPIQRTPLPVPARPGSVIDHPVDAFIAEKFTAAAISSAARLPLSTAPFM
jgi:hypothetical protein